MPLLRRFPAWVYAVHLRLPRKQAADWQCEHAALRRSEADLMDAAPVHRYSALDAVLADFSVLDG
ncbi:hypothetical protein Y71_29075 (plasmid) [Kosakonia radicincitans DSM 16656]|nr:hypothetical protein Y71_29075 [Kosakonia radicincitans DSM 16656]